MTLYRDDFASWAEYVAGELARFYDHTGGITYLFQNTPRANAYLARAASRGFTTEQAAFYGAPQMVRGIVTAEFRQWWIEHWGTERVTFSEWRERAAEAREQVAWEESAERSLDQLDMLRRLTAERDALILDAASKGATKVAIARSVGLSRQQVHTIIANATVPDVAPFAEWEQDAPAVVEIAPEAAWGEVF
ncbi:hypothetical protein SOM10_11890 [Microbacterium sp. CFBP9023]|uniref:hypothetical protein n=1 Tax=Microbacterium sp. CFBP9023 TaxID=3096535 RepID=UPI002A6A35F0|nr:hypothetical protein [Microbacterium sp. CFBP9023]MDY0984597.1 hypothetical protein [Microbacterium sp. CFBP9023]